jgi:hypothetical protein
MRKLGLVIRWVSAVLAGAAVLLIVAVVAFSSLSAVTCPALAGDEVVYKTHDRGWIDDHSMDAKLDSKSCEMCHEREFCNACHFSDNPLKYFHNQNFVYTHTLDRYIDETECTSCHDYGSFCNACHTAAAGRPADHLSAGWTTTGHPEAARDDIENCAACHGDLAGERVCLNCHRIVNPHGDDFLSGVSRGPWHDDPGYVCYECHSRTPGSGFCIACHE